MTSTTSFKGKLKQIKSMFLWELKSCTGTLVVYAIIAAVLITITFTLCAVLGFSSDSGLFGLAQSMTADSNSSQTNAAMQFFQLISSEIVYYLTIIFTIFYTIKVYSYMHNKRKTDLYGSMPISRVTLLFSKTASAYIFSVIPALFFLGIISIISIYLGQPIISDVSQIYIKITLGTFACVSAYGLISVCCGTTLNTVIMFIMVCVAYPLSALFVKGVFSSFYTGLYLGIIKNSFIMNALNPLAAYDGINVVYWIVFSLVCLAGGALLAKNRKSERAQSSFAYYLPCHIVKVLVSFLMGMFLGVLFGSLNVFGYGYFGFVFGFILGSVPTFVICHLIFYKGFSKLAKSSIVLGGLIAFVIGGMALCNFDVFGYNSSLPREDDIKSAGFIQSSMCFRNNDEEIKKYVDNSSEDFTDKKNIKTIYKYNSGIFDLYKFQSNEKFASVWGDMITSNLPFTINDNISFSYKLKNGSTFTRVYSTAKLNYTTLIEDSSSESYNNFSDITKQKNYVQKYSGMANAVNNQIKSLSVIGMKSDKDATMKNVIFSDSISSIKRSQRITDAIKKDMLADSTNATDVISEFDYSENNYFDDFNDENYYEKTDEFIYSKRNNNDIVCRVDLSASNNNDNGFTQLFSGNFNICGTDEVYLIPSRYKNTINVLQSEGILDNSLIMK